jgi:hypothetical protein
VQVLKGIQALFRKKGEHLFWKRLPASQIVGAYRETPIEKDQAYLLLRLKEMYLLNTRKLWRKYHPMLHSYLRYGGGEEVAVTGPGQMKELGEAGLDRVVSLNHRLAGPIPYQGGDITMLVGLYSVPGQDATKALVDTVGKLAALGGIAAGPALEVTNVVKAGVESILSFNETSLSLGVEDTFYESGAGTTGTGNQGNPLRAGLYIGISAPSNAVDFQRLWLKDGQLFKGVDPIQSKPYEDHDYMILEVESRPSRDDWPGLPVVADFEEQFAVVMRDSVVDVPGKRERLARLWPQFVQALSESPQLITRDREQIALSVSTDLNKRLDAIANKNPFVEVRAWGESKLVSKSPEDFDFLDVPDYLDPRDSAQVSAAREALSGNPFGG